MAGGWLLVWIVAGRGVALEDECPAPHVFESLAVFNAAFCPPDLTNFLGLESLVLVGVALHLQPGRAVEECMLAKEDDWCGS